MQVAFKTKRTVTGNVTLTLTAEEAKLLYQIAGNIGGGHSTTVPGTAPARTLVDELYLALYEVFGEHECDNPFDLKETVKGGGVPFLKGPVK